MGSQCWPIVSCTSSSDPERMTEEVVEEVLDQGEGHILMTDACAGTVKVENEIPGAPNWRRLPGFPVYATGQPECASIAPCVASVLKKYDEQKSVVWVSVRQEPCLYVNGKPYSVRNKENPARHLVIQEGSDIASLEQKVAKGIKKEDKFQWVQDEVGEKSKEICPDYKPQEGRPDSILTLGDSLAAEVKKQGKLKTMRIPFNLYAAPSVESVDALIKLLKVEGSAVPVIMSDQTGQGRASTAAVMAGVIKEAQFETEFAKMRGIVPDDIIDDLRSKKLHPEPPPRGKDANALMLGEFPVVMDLVGSVEGGKEAKAQVDRIIDAVGVENIRENVVMDKMQFDVAGDEWRELLKERIMDQIEKYFMLIVFALYCKEAGPDDFSQTFSSWLSSTSYQDQIATGKGKLEWERKIPDDKISALKDLMNVEKFDENLPEVINQINQLSYKTFNDLPRGDQKCKSMRKLAGRTLIDVLPPKLSIYLEEKLGDLNKVPDFYDMVGQLSYYGKCQHWNEHNAINHSL